MNLPPLFYDATLDKIPNELIYKEVIVRFIKDFKANLIDGRGLYLWGDYSSGKTALSCILLKSLASIGKMGLFISARDIPKYIIEKVRFDSKYTFVDRMEMVDLLVIDELILKEGKDSFVETSVETIFRARLIKKKATIFTSNNSPSTVKQLFPALYAAMQEAVFPVRVAGKDFRAEKRRQLEKDFEKAK